MNKSELTEKLKSLPQSTFKNQEILSLAAENGISHNEAYKIIRSMYNLLLQHLQQNLLLRQ